MGAHYGSILIKTENSELVQKVLALVAKSADAKFLVGPAIAGWISVFPDHHGVHDLLSAAIARYFPEDVFHLIVHDDDLFNYHFYRGGVLVDKYNSNPGYPNEDTEEQKTEYQGHPELFQDLIQKPATLAGLKALLAHERFTFESERISQFAEMLALPNAVGSYEYLQAGEDYDIEGAEQFIHIEFEPVSAKDYNSRGEARRANGNLDGALADFEKAVELDPALTVARVNHTAVEQAKKGRNKQSAEHFSQFGDIQKAEGDLDGALAAHTRAIELNPKFAQAYNLRGGVHRARRDLAAALADYNRAIELEPDFAVAYGNRGLVKLAQGDAAGARADYDRAIELKPDSVQAHNSRGELKRAQGDWEGALADYNRAIELQPDLAVAYNNRARVKRSQGDLNGALADFDKAIQLKPTVSQFFNNRGELKRATGDVEGALADFNQAIEVQPKSHAAYNNRGELKRGRGDREGALADYSRAIQLKPNYAVAYNNRGVLKGAQGDWEAALADFDKALELQPNFPAAQKNREAALRARDKRG